jgi:hypothetical protein
LEVLVMHLLKWCYQPERREESHTWYATILEQRSQVAQVPWDNPSLYPQVPALLSEVYPDARLRVIGQIGESAQRGFLMPLESRLPLVCPWSAAEVLATDFWPTAWRMPWSAHT